MGAGQQGTVGTSGGGSGAGAGGDIDWGGGTGTGAGGSSAGRAAELDRELDRALEDFDGEILAEQEALARAGGGSGAADAAGRSTDTSAGAAAGGGSGEGPRLVSGNIFGDDDDDMVPGGGMTGRGPMHPGLSDEEVAQRVPDDVGDGRNDDIVARQLREAAINEPDPELRERLWEEYRDYKSSIGR